MNHSAKIGRYGEQLAAAYLVNKGYTILATNWQCPTVGELDIIAQHTTDPDLLVVVEVRTRHATNTETAFVSLLQKKKRQSLINTIHAYLDAHHSPDTPWRLDVIAIALRHPASPLIDHVEDAFDW